MKRGENRKRHREQNAEILLINLTLGERGFIKWLIQAKGQVGKTDARLITEIEDDLDLFILDRIPNEPEKFNQDSDYEISRLALRTLRDWTEAKFNENAVITQMARFALSFSENAESVLTQPDPPTIDPADPPELEKE